MNERTMQIRLMQYCLHKLQHKAVIPNSTFLLWGEVDLLSVTKAGLVHEFEIKCSRSNYLTEIGSNNKYNKAAKHQRLQNPDDYERRTHIPNYFWFVTYDFEIEPPPYTGWILITEYTHYPDQLYLQVKKKAPKLHTDKWDDAAIARIARLLSFRLLKVYEK